MEVLAWFSGTGCTKQAALTLETQLIQFGRSVENCRIESCMKATDCRIQELLDLELLHRLYVLFPVYAFSAPELVLDWAMQLPKTESKTPVAVVSISGGGELWPNTASRVELIDILTEKGYNVDYERMLVMPINLLVKGHPELNSHLIRILPEKINHMILEIDSGKVRRTARPITTPLLIHMSQKERSKVRFASKYFSVKEACTRCMKCIRNCPRDNIILGEQGLPVFLNQCLLCLRCYYDCPEKAIYSTSFQKWLFDEFNMAEMIKASEAAPNSSTKEAGKGILFIAVKWYLEDISF